MQHGKLSEFFVTITDGCIFHSRAFEIMWRSRSLVRGTKNNRTIGIIFYMDSGLRIGAILAVVVSQRQPSLICLAKAEVNSVRSYC